MWDGPDALFTAATELIEQLSASSRDGKLRDAFAAYMQPHVLVVDEVGHLPRGRAMICTTNTRVDHVVVEWTWPMHNDSASRLTLPLRWQI